MGFTPTLHGMRGLSGKSLQEIIGLSSQAELLTGLFHDLNNSLTAILGYAQLLEGTPSVQEMRNDLGVIQAQVARSKETIESFRRLFEPCPDAAGLLEMNSLLSSVLTPLSAQARFMKTELRKDLCGHDLPFWGNLFRWRTALTCLLLRAVCMGNGARCLQVRTVDERERGFMKLTIEALQSIRGEGSASEQPRLASLPFEEGVDLGLGLVAMAVEESAGRVQIARPFRGEYQISISLPFMRPEEVGHGQA